MKLKKCSKINGPISERLSNLLPYSTISIIISMTAALHKRLILLLVIISIFSCNTEESKNSAEKTEIQVIDSAESSLSISKEDSTLLFSTDSTNHFLLASKIPLDWNKIHLVDFWVEDSLPFEKIIHSTEFFKDYGPVLRWSQDSNYILDLGSYGKTVVTEPSGKKILTDGDVDNKISLIDIKNHKKKELIFFGSDTELISAGWLSTNQLAILASRYHPENFKSDTILWIINIHENFFRKYQIDQKSKNTQ